MTSIRENIVFAACHRAYALTDYNTQDTIDKRLEFMQQTILDDKSLTKDEKSNALENVESANKSWFEECKSHLSISNKYGHVVQCYELMEQCWDADPSKRPDIDTLYDEIKSLYRSYLINENDEQQTNNITSIDNFQLNTNFSISSTNSINSFFRNSSSRVYYFKDLPEPRNATKEEQEAYHSIQFDFDLQDGMITEVKDESNKRIYFNEGQDDLTINPKKIKLDNNDKDDDDPNFHSEEQAELKVSDCKMDLNYLLN
ncbi:kinase-like domain-containing protein [Rhizophagus irregularis DAOM 181602=DAOM 197198]|nr:kinase-like domain-containing protein [Rhizophagus irregularis DAOM 181602=DAOM 197198]